MQAKTRRTLIIGILSCIVLVVLGVFAVHVIRLQRHYSEADKLDALFVEQLADYRAYWRGPARFAPPVLRGSAVEGNAIEVQRPLVEAMALPSIPDSYRGSLERCERPEEDVLRLVTDHEAELATFRATALRSWSRAETDLEKGLEDTDVPSFKPHLLATRLLLIQASLSAPDECLRICADVVRIAHQVVPGAGLIGAMIASAEIERVPPVVTGCARAADAEALRTSSAEFLTLAKHAPPLGESLEMEALLGGATMRKLTSARPWIPTSGVDVESMAALHYVLDAWKELTLDPAQYRAIQCDSYPSSLGIWSRAAARVRGSSNPLLGMGTAGFDKYIHRDMETQARLRAIAVLLEHLSHEDEAGAPPAAPPAILQDKALTDPFDGKPLRWDVDTSSSTVRVWSIGINVLDDRGVTGADDVVVTSACVK